MIRTIIAGLAVISKIVVPTVVVEQKQYQEVSIPTWTSAKTYEDGGNITDTSSDCYQVMKDLYVDERGHYTDGENIAVAMGNYFDEVGSKYKITLDTGIEINVIKADQKADQDVTNQMLDSSNAMIEFIIDTETAKKYYGVGNNGYILNGSFNNHNDFKGKIVKVEKELSK